MITTTLTTPIEAAAARDVEIIIDQVALFDHSGHVRRGLSRARAAELLDRIQANRAANGWKPLDLTGRWYPRGKAA